MFELLLVCAYLLGSLSFAIMLSRYYGNSDPRSQGSGNPGATNMLRVAGKCLAILTLLGDLSKGLLPILLASHLGFDKQQQAWIGLAAVIGHLYPLYFNFRGGKGVATTAGMLIGLYPPAALLGDSCLAANLWPYPYQLTGRISQRAVMFAAIGLAATTRLTAR